MQPLFNYMQTEITSAPINVETRYETDSISPPADRVTTGQCVQATGLRDSLKRCSPRSPRGCLCPSRRGYLERRQAEAIGEVVCLLFRDLLFAQAQAQLLKRDDTDVAGHVVALWVQRVGLAGVKVVNKATFA